MTLGNTIASYRKQLGITQEALAQQLDVTNQAVSKWESDQSCPDVMLLPKLADIFDISIDELFGRELKTAPADPTAANAQAAPSAQAPIIISHLPWKDDDTLYAVLYKGHRLMKTQGFGSTRVLNEITFKYDGPALNVHSYFTVVCGNVEGNVDAGSRVECGNVGGDVEAGSRVECGNVDGNVDAGSRVDCQDVGGNIDAGSSITCGNVGGNASAGGNIECGPVTGSVDAGGKVVIKQS